MAVYCELGLSAPPLPCPRRRGRRPQSWRRRASRTLVSPPSRSSSSLLPPSLLRSLPKIHTTCPILLFAPSEIPSLPTPSPLHSLQLLSPPSMRHLQGVPPPHHPMLLVASPSPRIRRPQTSPNLPALAKASSSSPPSPDVRRLQRRQNPVILLAPSPCLLQNLLMIRPSPSRGTSRYAIARCPPTPLRSSHLVQHNIHVDEGYVNICSIPFVATSSSRERRGRSTRNLRSSRSATFPRRSQVARPPHC